MNTETFYPYSFNGGGEYDGYEEEDVEEPQGQERREGDDGANDKKMFLQVMEEYVNTGSVADPKNAKLFHQVFPELELSEHKTLATIGTGEVSEVTGRTEGRQINEENRTTRVQVDHLVRLIRIPEKSVDPLHGQRLMGNVMRDFLDEVERNIPGLRDKQKQPGLFQGFGHRKRNREENREEEEENEDGDEDPPEGDQFEAISVRSEKDIAENVNLEATMKLHAPWVKRPKFKAVKAADDQNENLILDHDMTVSTKAFSRYLRALRTNRIATFMKDDHTRTELVTLVLESESDVWNACGGQHSLSPDTWITKRVAKQYKCEDMEESTYTDLRENFRDFLEERGERGPGYVTDERTLESQVYHYLKRGNPIEAQSETRRIVNAFEDWIKTNCKKTRNVPLTAILRDGGDRSNYVQEHADRLVTLAIMNGYVKDNASNARDQLLFTNDLPKKKKYKDPLQITSGMSRVLEGTSDAEIVEYFRKGKEKFIANLTDSIGCDGGGPNAKLVIDMEYRKQFIKLCRANYLLNFLDYDSRVVTDRRKRILDQERVKRECLYFFQSKNGMASRINAEYVR